MVLSDGLVGYWSAWQWSSGYRLIDRTRYANNGTLTNMDAGTDWVASSIRGKSGFVLDLDGSNDYVSISDSTPLNPTKAITGAIWNKPAALYSSFGYSLVSKQTNVNAEPYASFDVRGASGNIWQCALSIGATNKQISLGTQVVGEWALYLFTYNGSVFSGYKNGVLVASSSQTGDIGVSPSPIWIGGNPGFPLRCSAGQVAEFCLWNRGLTAAEILDLYRIGPGWYQPYQRKRYAFVGATFNRRRRILCGDYS